MDLLIPRFHSILFKILLTGCNLFFAGRALAGGSPQYIPTVVEKLANRPRQSPGVESLVSGPIFTNIEPLTSVQPRELSRRSVSQFFNNDRYNLISLSEACDASQACYEVCSSKQCFSFTPFPLAQWPELHPNSGVLQETFIAHIPQASIYRDGNIAGLIVVDNKILQESLWPSEQRFAQRHPLFELQADCPSQYIPGAVAVIAQEGKAYAHWILESLCRLALLEMHDIPWDYIYTPLDQPFKKETLQLWGISLEKIVSPKKSIDKVDADTVIFPSLVGRKFPPINQQLFCLYTDVELLTYVRDKLLSGVDEDVYQTFEATPYVFISRQDASVRKLINEEELFQQLEPYGFRSYELSTLSVQQQMALFAQAKVIIGCHGSGMANTLFCKPGTQIIEIFQQRGDCSFWYLSQQLGLNHTCIKTTDFIRQNGNRNTELSPENIADILDVLQLHCMDFTTETM